jgi:aminobenzoyl-glutamate utilization protein A
MGAAEGMISDLSLATRVHTVCSEKLGMPVPENPIRKAGGSEDVSYMMNRVQEQGGIATFMRLMTPMSGPAHDRTYDFGEEVLVNSIRAFCGTVADLLAK